jgi:hypothetical protein
VILGDDNRSGYCGPHAPKSTQRAIHVGDAQAHAEALVTAWVDNDYEPDDVNPRFMSERSVDKLIARVAEVFAGQLMRPPVPTSGTRARRDYDAGIIKIGTPREASPVVAGEQDVRVPECPAYTLCLEHVLKQGWRGWTCRGCAGPGSEAAKREAWALQSKVMKAKRRGGG